MPISLVDENMKRAHYNDALLKSKFWFNLNCFDNTNIESDLTKFDSMKSTEDSSKLMEPHYEELYIHEILNGKGDFPGMLNLIRIFMDLKNYSDEHKNQVEVMFEFLDARAKGAIPTGAQFIRNVVTSDPLYNQDSIVGPELNTNLIKQMIALNGDLDLKAAPKAKSSSDSSEKNEEKIFDIDEDNKL